MYSSKIDGGPTTFGTSGLLYRSNKLMYDRLTKTLWSSLVGRPVIGKLAMRDDLVLDYFPVALTTWREWLEEHPYTGIISDDTGYYPHWMYEPEHETRSFYYSYRAISSTMFPVWNRDDRLKVKDEVLALSEGDSHKAYPIRDLNEMRLVNDVIGETEIVILASSKSSDARVFERKGRQFALDSDEQTPAVPKSIIDQDGQTWRVFDVCLIAPDGEILERLPSYVSFWFGWYAFHPDTLLYEPD
ncbi:MAG: DUF3179 domain-containing protein [Dehalococcoidia bacterium]|nr:DUF3179 domain-containing protein [Dehalococcoidia bacterium]